MGEGNLKLPDTPWHVGFALKDEDDPRRHKARCIYYNNTNKKCMTAKSPYFMLKCGGSAHCRCYLETSEIKEEKNITTNQGNFKQNKRTDSTALRNAKKKDFLNNSRLLVRKSSIVQFKYCPICKGKLSLYIKTKLKKKPLELGKKCYLCSTIFIDKDKYEIHKRKLKRERSDICLMKLEG